MPIPESSGDYSAWDEDPPDLQDADAEPSGQAPPIDFVADATATGQRLDKWLAERLPCYSRNLLQRWIAAGAIQVDGAQASVRQPVWPGERIHILPQPIAGQAASEPEDIPLAIVHEDAAILVIDKPAGLVVHPAAGNWSGTLLNGLLHHAPSLAGVPRAGIVHRLDKDTTGLMVVAKTVLAQIDLVRQLQERTVRREYLALVWGDPPASGAIDAPIGRHPRDRTRMAVFKPGHPGAKEARTNYRVLSRCSMAAGSRERWLALVCCRLETGRTHQIRVHMQSAGYPLAGDPVYGIRDDNLGFGRQALHAWRLGLAHPVSRAPCEWRAAPPGDMQALIERLGLEIPHAP